MQHSSTLRSNAGPLLTLRALCLPRACALERRWREYRGFKCDFTLLDRNGGAGWDLAKKLVCKRDPLNRWVQGVGWGWGARTAGDP